MNVEMRARVDFIYGRNGSRKPRVPMEKLRTGGTAPDLNKEDACKIVPSPPSVNTRSIGAACSPELPLSPRYHIVE